MYAYELHQLNVAELIRRADQQRTVRQAVLARRAARRARRQETEGRVGAERSGFVHAA
ncbi:hypothetical protein [Streptomyces sp. NBC_00059]|uniref:hypothetical protein n=1 Tax=Streptomyces sp. NBC_00059 TaxID=2975635 RepID=UPI00224E0FAD|nr:hypothetical protein [Streptomyces sp. NBC_00059]MCX5416779.1 hypothetical protein [Streptomyces sp. NBC_00059]